MFGHGRLRLYLLGLLGERPRHGYDVIRVLHGRCRGLYAPSAGTVYPRLARLEREGLVTHAVEDGRKVYALTDAGRAEVRARAGELAALERQIRAAVRERAGALREALAGDLGGRVSALPGYGRISAEQAERVRRIIARAAYEVAEILAAPQPGRSPGPGGAVTGARAGGRGDGGPGGEGPGGENPGGDPGRGPGRGPGGPGTDDGGRGRGGPGAP